MEASRGPSLAPSVKLDRAFKAALRARSLGPRRPALGHRALCVACCFALRLSGLAPRLTRLGQAPEPLWSGEKLASTPRPALLRLDRSARPRPPPAIPRGRTGLNDSTGKHNHVNIGLRGARYASPHPARYLAPRAAEGVCLDSTCDA
jgi:hypothetical protein